MLRLLLIGYGPIAAYAAEKLAQEDRVTLAGVMARPGREDAARALLGGRGEVWTSVEGVPHGAVDLAADCAGHAGLQAHGPALLARGVDLVSLSVGALADDGLAKALEEAAREGGAQIELAPGAIGGLDALTAAAVGGLDSVAYTARKPPAGWRGTPAEEDLDLDALREPRAHFRGPAREAARRYPKNANVAAAVALAGLGLDRTEAVLIADPTLDGNRHEVTAEGAFGRLSLTLDGRTLPDNPKSSALAAMSLVRTLRRRVAPVTL
ncbi:MAG: aspartate dehydrogenase [Marivibrio sp.]|uniref:aspartate dehydrogenase n=1 Tax=Marivibrio sp. TaxID=2039719 RepID=UPI0032F04891